MIVLLLVFILDSNSFSVLQKPEWSFKMEPNMSFPCIKIPIAFSIKSIVTMAYKLVRDLASASLPRLILNHFSSLILLRPQWPFTSWKAPRSFPCQNFAMDDAVWSALLHLFSRLTPCSTRLNSSFLREAFPYFCSDQNRFPDLCCHCTLLSSSSYHIYNEMIIHAIIYWI